MTLGKAKELAQAVKPKPMHLVGPLSPRVISTHVKSCNMLIKAIKEINNFKIITTALANRQNCA